MGRDWDQWAKKDPLWAILTQDDKRGNRWDHGEFMATGRGDVDAALGEINALGLALRTRNVLDFGCGVGRLSQALAEHFGQVNGVDASAEYVRLAEQYNRHPDRVSYRVSGTEIPFADNSFDLVFSRLTLQHTPRRRQLHYVAEFVRVARPRGVLAFQFLGFPHHAKTRVRQRLSVASNLYLRLRTRAPLMLIDTVPPERLRAQLEKLGASVTSLRQENDHGVYSSFRVIAQKR